MGWPTSSHRRWPWRMDRASLAMARGRCANCIKRCGKPSAPATALASRHAMGRSKAIQTQPPDVVYVRESGLPPLQKRGERSYYAEVWPGAPDAPGRLIDMAFGARRGAPGCTGAFDRTLNPTQAHLRLPHHRHMERLTH